MSEVNPINQTETKTQPVQVDVNLEKAGAITIVNSTDSSALSQAQLKEITNQVVTILSELPMYVVNFFENYQKAIITIGLIVAGGITLKVTFAVIDSLNDVPLLAPIFELVGMGYTVWFVYRYLLRAASRQELSSEIASLKEQILGK
jgi:glutamyl-tRNA synthetase